MKQTLKSYFLLIFFLQIIWTDTSIFFFFHYLLLVCNQVYMIKELFFLLRLLLIAFYIPVVLFLKFNDIHIRFLPTMKLFPTRSQSKDSLQKLIFMFIWKNENPIFDRSHFLKLGKQDKDSIKSCCPIQMKTGVQIIGGLLAILSGTVLVLFFAMLDEIIGRKYFQIYEVREALKKLYILRTN